MPQLEHIEAIEKRLWSYVMQYSEHQENGQRTAVFMMRDAD
ncbi:MAG: hypothetical protein WBP44_03105 [Gammaproteobacteria bacterium]|jgi:hypothetical protein